MTEVVPSSALSGASLRLLCHNDTDTVKHLCADWFPIRYPDSWYRDITSNKFFSLAATYRGTIVGMTAAEIKSRSEIHKETIVDYIQHLGSALANLSPCSIPHRISRQAHSLLCSFLPRSSISIKGGIEYSQTM
ncbi:N-alpha-acetyltransferase 60-like isoform X3 [Eptesicus fuscus]|uniref:N-alpha-acetyltransferase 60-like isoform X3 n=1 Tax=Eptesicus fuscus TaxID=29078 RepID=UPI00240469C2|nr:N-alpha-acetyltransferase 60-like isoform X3 [Eptesicus fuscus]